MMNQKVYLPTEIWMIILSFKKRIETRDDCILDKNPTILRNGKLIYKTGTRIDRLMNDSAYLLFSVPNNNNVLKIKKLCNLVYNYYYFIKTNQKNIKIINQQKKLNSINGLLNAVESKIKEFHNIFTYSPEVILEDMTFEEKNLCCFLLRKCKYFMDNLYEIEKYSYSSKIYENFELFNKSDFKIYCN